MNDFEFLRKIKEMENKRIAKLLKKDPLAIEKETIKTFKSVVKKNPQMVESVELVKTNELTI